MISLKLNGETRECAAGTVSLLVTELGLTPQTLVIEYNGDALHRSDWAATTLREGDCIEFVRLAAGG